MRAEDFELLNNLEEQYWWFVGMRRILDVIGSPASRKSCLRVLDAGCGTGYNLAARDLFSKETAHSVNHLLLIGDRQERVHREAEGLRA